MKAESGKGYPLFFLSTSPTRTLTTIVTLLAIGLAIATYIWFIRVGGDPTPDSVLGYTFALSGTSFLILAAISYTAYRQARKRAVGKLNGALQWHIAFAIISFCLLFLHSFGNFNQRTGTWALYGMIALVVSGFLGRFFDRLMPRLIAKEVSKALTEQGEDRIESITQHLHSVVVHNTQEELRTFSASPGTSSASSNDKKNTTLVAPVQFGKSGTTMQTSWDLAYISLEETPQEMRRDAQYRFVPDRKSVLTRPGALIPGAQEHMASLQHVEKALEQEQFYRYVIRYWRIFHVLLALTTVGLTIWHIVFALQLLIPVWLHH